MTGSTLVTACIAALASLAAAYPQQGVDGGLYRSRQSGNVPSNRMFHSKLDKVSEPCLAALNGTCPVCPHPSNRVEGEQETGPCAAQCSDRRSDECRQCHKDMRVQCGDCVDVNVERLIAAGCTQLSCKLRQKELCPVCELNRASCEGCRHNDTTAECVNCQESRSACHVCVQENTVELETVCGDMRRRGKPMRGSVDGDLRQGSNPLARGDRTRVANGRGFGYGRGRNGTAIDSQAHLGLSVADVDAAAAAEILDDIDRAEGDSAALVTNDDVDVANLDVNAIVV